MVRDGRGKNKCLNILYDIHSRDRDANDDDVTAYDGLKSEYIMYE